MLTFLVMVCAAGGYSLWVSRWCVENLHDYLDIIEIGVVLMASVPAWMWLDSWIAQLGARRYLARHVGHADDSPARARRRARFETVATASVVALVFVVSLGAPVLTLLALPARVHELSFALLITPGMVVGIAALLWLLLDRGRRAIVRDRANAIEAFAVARGHDLPLGLLDAFAARGQLFVACLSELPDLLRGIANGLAELDRLPAPLRVELERGGFDPRVLATPLRRGLARGVSTRTELHEINLALRELVPLLCAAIVRDVRSR